MAGLCLFIPIYALRRRCKNPPADISRIFLSIIKPMEIVSILEQPASGPEINPGFKRSAKRVGATLCHMTSTENQQIPVCAPCRIGEGNCWR
jgi:hypothetical protein